MIKFYLHLALLFVTTALFGQYRTITGTVYDAVSKMTLPSAHILITSENNAGTISDLDGLFTISTNKKEIDLVFRYIGYEDQVQKVVFKGNESVIRLDIYMQESTITLGETVITRGRYTKELTTSIQSLEVVGLKQIERENAVTLDKALGNVAGLTIVDNEPQMRGGSGFSSGMGSRVMILLDEMPILRADAGRPAWNLIPMEDVAQVEVLKGASSVMYGSAAINGAINVRTQFAKEEAFTKVNLYGGAYSKPSGGKSPWVSFTNTPVKFGAALSHSRKIKKVELTMGLEYADDDGYRGDTMALENPRGTKNHIVKAERRVRANVGAQYNINNQWTTSLGVNFMYSDNNQFHFWYDGGDNIYNTFPWTLSHYQDLIVFIDPQVRYIDNNGGTHSLKNRILLSNNKCINIESQDAASTTVYNAYNYKKILNTDYNLQIMGGMSNQYAYSYGTVFSGDTQNPGAFGSHFSNNMAFFARSEIDILPERNLNISLGARWELTAIDDFFEHKPVFQIGANYFLPVSHTYFRFNVGQGYRPATIGERYITTQVGDFGFFSNPDLKSETSLNTEIAIKQMFKIGDGAYKFEGFLDVAAFYQLYDNYIEFYMGPWRKIDKNKEPMIKQYGFKFFNTGPATIAGTEIMIAGQGKITEHLSYQINLGYTYSLPQALDPDYVYTTIPWDPNNVFTYNTTSSHKDNNILKYRIQHVGKGDLNITFLKSFTVGFSAKYFSQMKNLDKLFFQLDKDYYSPFHDAIPATPFTGITDYYENSKDGSWVFDFRFAFDLKKFTFGLIINNFLNTQYSLRPMHVEAPRFTSLNVTYKFSDLFPMRLFNKVK